jgi:RHS repeat-associated protein
MTFLLNRCSASSHRATLKKGFHHLAVILLLLRSTTAFALSSSGGLQVSSDPSGNLEHRILPSGAQHDFTYTPVNLQKTYTPPGNPVYSSEYDLDRRLTKVTLPGGRIISSSYDSGKRPSSTVYDAATVSYGYSDATERVTSITRTPVGGGTPQSIAISYDGSLVTGRTFSGTTNGQFTYHYNTDRQVDAYTLAGEGEIGLNRDVDGLTIRNGPFIITRAGPAGAISRITDNILQQNYTYDNQGRLATRTHLISGVQVYKLTLSYNNVGLISQRIETVFSTTHTSVYTYDVRGRLKVVTKNGTTTEQYEYDANDNRKSRKMGTAPAEIASFDSQDRLETRGTNTYQFNSDGFLATRNGDSFETSATGELTQATVGSSPIIYGYDGMGRRVSRTDSTGTTQYLYSAFGGSFELTASRSPAGVSTLYFYDDAGSLFAYMRGPGTFYVASDQVGSPRLITNSTRANLRTVDYDSFGGVTADSAPTFDFSVGYAGGLTEAATGLVRFGFRDYEPASGRWVQRDPIKFKGGMNHFAYVSNNPVQFSDPSGLMTLPYPTWLPGGSVPVTDRGELTPEVCQKLRMWCENGCADAWRDKSPVMAYWCFLGCKTQYQRCLQNIINSKGRCSK